LSGSDTIKELPKLVEAERRMVRQKRLELAKADESMRFCQQYPERQRVGILQKLGLTLGDK